MLADRGFLVDKLANSEILDFPIEIAKKNILYIFFVIAKI